MNDYIKRDDAVEKLRHLRDKCGNEEMAFALNWGANLIQQMFPADVRENVHGEWIDTGSGEECSVCHEIQYGYDSGRRFCASCGAIMDGGDDE